jgi:VanZ family protein
VLFGGRTGLRTRNPILWGLAVWLPVVICLMVILRESTDSFSSAQTNGPLRHLFEWIVGPVSPDRWDDIHHAMRKTGHFIGYGLTGLAWLRAWLLTWLAPLRLRRIWYWRRVGLVMGLFCTMIMAIADEIHQTYIPSRTGLMSDAWLDTAGAATLMLFMVTFWIRRPWQNEPPVRLQE